jgi:hypothetical protein
MSKTTSLLVALVLLSIVLSGFVGIVNADPRPIVELAYDDGESDGSLSGSAGQQFAVRFSLPTGWAAAKIVSVEYCFYYPSGANFKVCLYYSDGTTEIVKPFTCSSGFAHETWVVVDIKGKKAIVDGDFYVAIEYMAGAWSGTCVDAFDHAGAQRSYLRASPEDVWWPFKMFDSEMNFVDVDIMIRATLQQVKKA